MTPISSSAEAVARPAGSPGWSGLERAAPARARPSASHPAGPAAGPRLFRPQGSEAPGREWSSACRQAIGRWLAWCRVAPPLVLPLALLLTATLVFRWSSLDLSLTRPFYDLARQSWPYQHAQPWVSLYLWGEYPAAIFGLAGLAVALGGGRWERLRPLRYGGAFVGLFLFLGPGLIINVGFKDYWGRPRPFEVQAFGGRRPFVAVGDFGPERMKNSSFPSGHAAMGFYWMGPAFVLYRRHPRLARAVFAAGLLAGLSIGLGRVVQGRHFPSDIIWSAGLTYLTGWFLASLMFGLFQPPARVRHYYLPDDAATTDATTADHATAPSVARRAA